MNLITVMVHFTISHIPVADFNETRGQSISPQLIVSDGSALSSPCDAWGGQATRSANSGSENKTVIFTVLHVTRSPCRFTRLHLAHNLPQNVNN